jgi:hypothetical protein
MVAARPATTVAYARTESRTEAVSAAQECALARLD